MQRNHPSRSASSLCFGYFHGLAKPKQGFSDLPIWIGVRYYLAGGGQGFHVGVEAGLNELIVRGENYKGDLNMISFAAWGANVPLGYRVGGLDIQAQLSVLLLDHPGGSVAVGATVGYDFGI